MKNRLKLILGFSALGLICAFTTAVYFNRAELSGLKPILLLPPQDIVETINTTDMPLTLPQGYKAEIISQIPGARVLAVDPNGVILVSSPAQGTVFAVHNNQTVPLITKLNKPHGLALQCTQQTCTLFVAETNQLSSFTYNPRTLTATNPQKVLSLTTGGRHATKTLLFHPTDANILLIASGSSCDVCHESDKTRGAIYAYHLTEKTFTPFATGLRNAVFLTTHPQTKAIWVTEMGRDQLGDDLPPDEINIVEQGKHYGWPTCFGKNVHDTQFDKNTYIRNPCMEPFETPSHIDLPAHSAPLGLAFLNPQTLLVAYHGSWNRTTPTGYKVSTFTLDQNGNATGSEDFISGWLAPNNTAIGRPVDILIHQNIIYVTDDKAGVVYRFTPPPQNE